LHAQEANYAPPIVVRYAHFTTIGSAPLSPVMQALCAQQDIGFLPIVKNGGEIIFTN